MRYGRGIFRLGLVMMLLFVDDGGEEIGGILS